MRKWIVIAAVLCVLIGVAFSKTFGPKVVYDRTVDLGILQPGSVVETSFTIENHGLSPLRIYDFAADCSCMTPSAEGFSIRAKDSAEVPVKIVVPEGDQRHAFEVAFSTNDRRRPIGVSRIRAIGEYGVQFKPKRLIFLPRSIDSTEEYSEEIQVRVSENKPNLVSLSVASQVDFVSAAVATMNDRQATIKVSLAKPVISGDFKSHLHITHQLEGELPQLTDVLVCGKVDDTIQSSPPLIRFNLYDERRIEVKVDGPSLEDADFSFFGFPEDSIRVGRKQKGIFEVVLDEGMKEPDAGGLIVGWSNSDQRLIVPVSVRR